MGNGGRNGGIEGVGIEGDIVLVRRWYLPEGLVDTAPMQLIRTDEHAPVGPRGLELCSARAPGPSDTDLSHALHPGHLGRASQGAAAALADAPVVLASKVDMGVEVHDAHWPVLLVGPH